MTERTCCFTGHRHIEPGDFERLSPLVMETVEQLACCGYTCFITGAASGFDTIAGECILRMKDKLPGLELWHALPFRSFKAAEQLADRRIILSERYYNGCYFARDRWMAEHASLCIAYFSGCPGGTAYTVAEVLKRGYPILNLYEKLHK